MIKRVLIVDDNVNCCIKVQTSYAQMIPIDKFIVITPQEFLADSFWISNALLINWTGRGIVGISLGDLLGEIAVRNSIAISSVIRVKDSTFLKENIKNVRFLKLTEEMHVFQKIGAVSYELKHLLSLI